MSQPSIAELLNASGHTVYTPELVQRAMYSLYGNIGANLDERDWSAIMQSANPLQASEDALRVMYQDSAYLLRNTQHLTQSGYVAAQAEITYRQMAGRLDYTYNPAWSDGTPYDYLGDLTYEQLVSLVPAPPPPPPLPTISVSASATGFSVALNVAGTVKLSVSGDLGNFAAGSTVVTEQDSVKEGFLTLSANGNTSAATSQYVVLGTGGDNTIDATAAGSRVDYIFGGAGNDTLKGGAGDDVIVGGTGNDDVTGGDGADQLTGGSGADVFIYTTRDESYYAGAGTPLDTIADFETGTDKIRFSLSGSAVDASSFATVGNFVDGKNNSIAYSTVDKALYVSAAGANLNNTTAGAYVVSSANTIAAGDLEFAITGTGGDDVLKGGAGKDTITGGAGIDELRGGDGDDVFIIASAADHGNLSNGEKIYGGNGVDAIWFTSTTPNDTLNLSYWIDVEEVRIVAADGSENPTAGLGINADWLGVGPNIKLYGNAGNNSLVGNGDGNNTIEGGAGNDVIRGGFRSDALSGGVGVDGISIGVDASADTVRADEGDGQMLVAGEILHLDSDRVEQFNATHDKFVVSGAGTSVILGGVAATQTAGTTFQNVAFGTFDLNGTVGGAYITMAAVGSLRAFSSVQSVIGALANESVGEEAYFVLRDGIGGGNAGVYHFRSVTANGVVDVGEIELLGLILAGVGSNLTGLGAANFVFA